MASTCCAAAITHGEFKRTPEEIMQDRFGRSIRYLRLSVTGVCDFRCSYCKPAGECAFVGDSLSAGEIVEIARQAAALGVTKVRLTGGEPLMRGDILNICRSIAGIDGIQTLCLTTNGSRLSGLACALKDAGVRRVNISIDSLKPVRYREITGCARLASALEGLNAALQAGFESVKVNTVLIGGVNDDEIEDFVELTRLLPIDVRFIELMPIGPSTEWPKERFLPAGTVLKRCPALQSIGQSGVSQRYAMPGYLGAVGLIRAISGCFCQSCDRIRVTADGMLKPCLHGSQEIPLKGLTGEALRTAIADGIQLKPRAHALGEGPSRSARPMNAIGG
jgi:cyclic pyranopterin phosphate synthase